MVIITLEDGTQFMSDTDSVWTAKNDIKWKLRQRLDYRQIVDAISLPAKLDNSSACYNPIDTYKSNHQMLKASKGWSYKYN